MAVEGIASEAITLSGRVVGKIEKGAVEALETDAPL